MTEKELRKICGLKDGELINTSAGAMDIFSVKDDIVHLGFLASGNQLKETVDDFLKKMGKTK